MTSSARLPLRLDGRLAPAEREWLAARSGGYGPAVRALIWAARVGTVPPGPIVGLTVEDGEKVGFGVDAADLACLDALVAGEQARTRWRVVRWMVVRALVTAAMAREERGAERKPSASRGERGGKGGKKKR